MPAWYFSVVLPSYQSLTPGFMETGFLAMTQSKWVVVVILFKLTSGMFRAIQKGKVTMVLPIYFFVNFLSIFTFRIVVLVVVY